MKTFRSVALLLVTALMLPSGCASSTPTETDAAGEEAAEQPEHAEQVEPEQAESEQAESEMKSEQPAQPDPVEKGSDLPIRAVGPVAVIDGQEITSAVFNARIDERSSQMGRRMPRHMALMMKSRILDRLIDERLIDRELDAHADVISVTQSEVDDEFANFKERFPDQDAFEHFLKGSSLNVEKMKANLRKDLQLRKLLSKSYDIGVTDQDVRDNYDSNLARYERQEEEVRARHILIKLSQDPTASEVSQARTRAENLSRKAKEPNVDFAELAKKHSEGPSARRGGDLGYFPKRRMVPEFSDVAFAMKPGEISAPVQSQFGFHVILVEDIKPEGRVPFAEVEDIIKEQLLRQKYRDAVKVHLTKLKADVSIERKPDNIEINVEESSSTRGGPDGMKQLPPELKEELREQREELERRKNQQK